MSLLKVIFIISILTLVSCGQTKLQSSYLDKINIGDTLTLYAKFSDCGEWGGHIEKIQITKKTSGLESLFYKDSVSCENDPNLTRKKIIEISKPLSIQNENCIIKYIDSLLVKANKRVGILGNSCNHFELISKDKTYKYLDFEENWQGFNEMRNEIFTEKKTNP